MSDVEISRVPLLGAIRALSKTSDRLHASVVTTYSFNGGFYEDVLLRSFRGAGSRLNIVLADARQLSEAMNDEMRRPRRAGKDYVLCPIKHERAFHPKLLMLLSETQAGLGVGSHNLTDAGFAHNEELSAFWDMRQGAPRALVVEAVDYCLHWLARSGMLPDDAYAEIAHRLRALAAGPIGGAAAEKDCRLILDTQGALWSALESAVVGKVKRIWVIGPYFDRDFGMLRRLDKTFEPAEMIVAVDAQTVLLGDLTRAPASAKFVDVSRVTEAQKRSGAVGFLHAKLIAFETENERVITLGSANPTKAGWGLSEGNAEANIVFRGARADAAFAELGLDRLKGQRALSAKAMEGAAARSVQQREQEKARDPAKIVTPFWHGRRYGEAIFVCDGQGVSDIAGVEVWSGAAVAAPIEAAVGMRDGALVIEAAALPSGAYSLRRGGEIIAFVLVHDLEAVRDGAKSQDGGKLLASLGRIDQYEGFDEVFDRITRHVLDVDPTPRSTTPNASARAIADDKRKTGVYADAPYGPRGISLADERIGASRKRLFAQGLVADLISALIASLHVIPVPKIDGDVPDLDAEDVEESGEGGEEVASNVEAHTVAGAAPWPKIVATCRRRVTTLIRRLQTKFETIEPDAEWELARLVSVMLLVQKLRLLPPPTDLVLKAAPDSLVSGGQLCELYELAVSHLYGERKLSERLARVGGANVEERVLLDNQLLWYAREIGVDCDYQVSSAEDADTREEVLQARADIVVIAFSAAAGESEVWLKERANVLRRWSDAEIVERDWFARHRRLGEALQALRSPSTLVAVRPVRAEGYAICLAEPDLPRVVNWVTNDKASLFEPGGGKQKQFKLSALRGLDLVAARG